MDFWLHKKVSRPGNPNDLLVWQYGLCLEFRLYQAKILFTQWQPRQVEWDPVLACISKTNRTVKIFFQFCLLSFLYSTLEVLLHQYVSPHHLLVDRDILWLATGPPMALRRCLEADEEVQLGNLPNKESELVPVPSCSAGQQGKSHLRWHNVTV